MKLLLLSHLVRYAVAPVIALAFMGLSQSGLAGTDAGKPLVADSTNTTPATAATAAPPTAHHDHDSDSDDNGATAHIVINDDDKTTGAVIEALLIPLAGIVCTFGMPVLIVVVVMYFNFRRRRETLATVKEYLNKGLPVPPELLGGLGGGRASIKIDTASANGGDFRRGFKLTFVGLGVALALYFNNPHSTTWCWGLVPMVMGIGYLISAWVEKGQRPPERDPFSPPKP